MSPGKWVKYVQSVTSINGGHSKNYPKFSNNFERNLEEMWRKF